ncbi:phage/plasmid primase, P4 family [Tropicibacter sp. S64]|uniref:phage/plasmid primase, P4 family n=1 Tax=Tropicibacter sp. S64 TaxID=3415122 RepID=UPI003C7CF80D
MTGVMTTTATLDAALDYARRGWFIFPLQAGTKGQNADGTPSHLLARGHRDASDEEAQVRAWWTRWPDANIGLNLAASGLVAIDVDAYKADCAWETFRDGRTLPLTRVQRSARGGVHYIFLAEDGRRYPGRLCDGVDVKHNGYILLAPSTFDGKPYRFETDAPPGPAPGWFWEAKPQVSEKKQAAQLSPGNASIAINPDRRADVAEVESLLSYINPDADGYHAWIEVLQGLHDHFGGRPEGLSIAERWSERGSKFTPGEVARKWQGFTEGGGVTLRTIAHRARMNGADISAIARRQNEEHRIIRQPADDDDTPDLSHDHLALDLGERSWNASARHVALWGKWLFWTGTHWQRDEKLEHLTRGREFLRSRASELMRWAENRVAEMSARGDATGASKLMKSAKEQSRSLRSKATLVAVTDIARANPRSAASHLDFDSDLLLLGTPGGTVDLRTGELRRASREDMISRLTHCAPAAAGTRPKLWLQFLSQIVDGDTEMTAFLQRAAGYALTGSTAEHKLLFLYGSGRNGKSVFLNTLLDIWGDYGRRVPATTFLHSTTERHPTDIAGLQGARLAVASELPRGKTWDEAVIKDLTGGDRMSARFMRQDFFEFDPQMTLMIAGNTQPSFRGVDEAIRSRVVLVPFTVTIPAEKRDTALPDKLRAEAPAILRWCIDGALDWQRQGLAVPPSIAAASKAYFDEEDTVAQFLEDETFADPHAIALTETLITRFNGWSERQGLGSWAKRTLVKELKNRGYTDTKTNGHRGLRGLRLK